MDTEKIIENVLPVIPARNVVIFPKMILPMVIGRSRSIKAINKAFDSDKLILCVAQISSKTETPKQEDIYSTGVVCEILQLLKMPDGTISILIEGLQRAQIKKLIDDGKYLRAEIELVFIQELEKKSENAALMKTLEIEFKEYVKFSKSFPEEALIAYENLDSDRDKVDLITGNIDMEISTKQELLEVHLFERMIRLIEMISKEVEIHKIRKKIESEVKSKLSKTQREYFLHQEIQTIKEELGVLKDETGEVNELKKKFKKLKLSPEAKEKVSHELKKLKRTNPISPEYSVSLNYLNWIADMPWGSKGKKKSFKLEKAEKILDIDHYGLKKVKERILEFLAVLKIAKKVKGQILCLVGPPGVGKTSLGKSIARAMNRRFERLSLGGVRDEAEIRGHRKTYIGAMPGVIVRAMKKAGVQNPVIMLDEVDKMSTDFRGDPSAALLEVLDPEQNFEFHDHYLEIPYDLSKVLFITTANTLYSIPIPLQDRMEIIKLPGYTEFEKEKIAKGFLLPKQLKNHGISEKLNVSFSDNAILKIIRNYTREAGVRELDRNIASILRKIIRGYLKKKSKINFVVNSKSIIKYLGVEKYRRQDNHKNNQIGVANGLAWTSVGGEMLNVEALLIDGKGTISLTGKLGDVMKESANAALSYSRAHYEEFGIDKNFFKDKDIHIHVPEGAIPKDGPSAGITIALALISAFSKRKIKANFAMTGEITLMGKVLPIGGLEEKLVAAKRARIENIIIPKDNIYELKEVRKQIKRGLNIIAVENMKEVVNLALE
ncbi:MAG: endopeptidase La [Candidatus Cloacimonadota bacterium]|nr:endopeptidase La [Candidatus Cloacimonadota bacterium]